MLSWKHARLACSIPAMHQIQNLLKCIHESLLLVLEQARDILEITLAMKGHMKDHTEHNLLRIKG